MAQPYVQRVVSNIKGGVDTELAPKVVISGPPRSGKSAIVNAVELALTGGATDVAGRDAVKTAELVLPLADGKRVTAEAVFSDGRVSKFEIGGTSKRGKVISPDGFPADLTRLFPLWGVREALTGSADKAREFLLPYVIAGVKREEIERQIPPQLHPLWKEAIQEVSIAADIATRLNTALENAAKKARDAGTKASLANEVAVSSGGNAELPPNEHEIDSARAAVAKLRGSLETLVGERATIQAKAKGAAKEAERVAEAKRAREELIQAALAAEEELASLKEDEAGLSADLDACLAAVEANPMPESLEHLRLCAKVVEGRSGSPGPCPVCDSVVNMNQVRADLDRTIAFVEAASEKAVEAQKNLAEIESLAEKFVARCNELEKTIAEATGLAGPDDSDSDSDSAPGGDSDSSEALSDVEARIQQVRVEIAAAEVELSKLESAAASWRPAQVAVTQSVQLTQRATEWKLLVTVLEKLIAQYVKKGVDGVTANIQQAMPDGLTFGLELTSKCRIGLRQDDGFLRTALSGSEWASLLVAITVMYADPSIPQVVVPDDRGYDLNLITTACEAWSNAPAQVIFPTTVPIGEKALPSGWTLVSLWG